MSIRFVVPGAAPFTSAQGSRYAPGVISRRSQARAVARAAGAEVRLSPAAASSRALRG